MGRAMRTAGDDDEQRRLTLAHAMPILCPGSRDKGAWSMEHGHGRTPTLPCQRTRDGEPACAAGQNDHTACVQCSMLNAQCSLAHGPRPPAAHQSIAALPRNDPPEIASRRGRSVRMPAGVLAAALRGPARHPQQVGGEHGGEEARCLLSAISRQVRAVTRAVLQVFHPHQVIAPKASCISFRIGTGCGRAEARPYQKSLHLRGGYLALVSRLYPILYPNRACVGPDRYGRLEPHRTMHVRHDGRFSMDECDRLASTHQDEIGALAHAHLPSGTNFWRMRCLNAMRDGSPTGTAAPDVPVNDISLESHGNAPVVFDPDVDIRFLEDADKPG